jgi:hypothetical protein
MDALFFGRIDYQDLKLRVNESRAEFIWRAGDQHVLFGRFRHICDVAAHVACGGAHGMWQCACHVAVRMSCGSIYGACEGAHVGCGGMHVGCDGAPTRL